MTHKSVHEHFIRLHPLYAGGNHTWFPNGKDSIRIKFDERLEFIFTFQSNKLWSFETIDSWLHFRVKPRKE